MQALRGIGDPGCGDPVFGMTAELHLVEFIVFAATRQKRVVRAFFHNAAAHQHVAPRYIEQAPQEVGMPNMVTAVLASYRGYDTFGETFVIFTAGIAVLLLLEALTLFPIFD